MILKYSSINIQKYLNRKGVKMKIVHLCLGCFYIDNYSYQENMLPKFHKKMGHDVSIIASLLSFDEYGKACYLPKETKYLNEHDIQVTRIDYKTKFHKINKFFRIFNNTYQLIDQEEPDILFIHGPQFADIKQVVKYLKKNPHVKVYVDNHADFSNSATNWLSKNVLHKIIWKHYAKSIEPFASKIYGVLPARTDFLRSMYDLPKEKIEFLPMGADDERLKWEEREETKTYIREKYNIHKDDTLILTGGKIDLAKTQTLLLMKAVKNLPSNVKLLIFGSIVPEMKEKVLENCDGIQVQHIGWINSDDVYSYFHASDLGVFPGRHSVIWEQAVGSGLPCIFKYWEGTTHVDLGGNCLFLHEDSEEEIFYLLNSLIKDKEKIYQMKNISELKGIKYFSYADISARAISSK
jgi:1,2-diacylglycerol 3-alpha-glucosyltransferase